jgi:purine-binding chemotaxis protein CheW
MIVTPYLTFRLHESFYGIKATLIQEIFYLPELTAAIEAPREIVGVINLRGMIVPVMDLNLRLGRQPQPYQLSDSIIVLEWQEQLLGILVSQVYEVKNLDASHMEKAMRYGSRQETTKFTAGIAKVDGEIITILNPETLTQFLFAAEASENFEGGDATHPKQLSDYFSHLTTTEKSILRERAANLLQLSQNQDFTGLVPLAVIGLNGEYFGLDLKFVREFTDIRKLTPIPCCPAHILGNMNLRGEIVTLIDVRELLSLSRNGAHSGKQAMIVNIDEIVVGITVDEVLDITYINPKELKSVPAAVYAEGHEFLKGTAPYSGKMMGILDTAKLFSQGNLFVEEEV